MGTIENIYVSTSTDEDPRGPMGTLCECAHLGYAEEVAMALAQSGKYTYVCITLAMRQKEKSNDA